MSGLKGKKYYTNKGKVTTFTSSGYYHAKETRNIDYLVVAGGGGGGAWYAGGGGAGGFLTSRDESFPVTAGTTYKITVGSGGSHGFNRGFYAWFSCAGGGMGGDSSIAAGGTALVTAKGGGGGAGWAHGGNSLVYDGAYSGGSGGGAVGGTAYYDGSSPTHPHNNAGHPIHWSGWGALGTPGQGNDGGSAWEKVKPLPTTYWGSRCGGGGGGAGGAGQDGGPGPAPTQDGGDGLASDITGSSVTYAGGGGGARMGYGWWGEGGTGGGGKGGHGPLNAAYGYPSPTYYHDAEDGTTNTGGGGGGGCTGTYPASAGGAPDGISEGPSGYVGHGAGGAGGSGIVVILEPATTGTESSTGGGVHSMKNIYTSRIKDEWPE